MDYRKLTALLLTSSLILTGCGGAAGGGQSEPAAQEQAETEQAGDEQADAEQAAAGEEGSEEADASQTGAEAETESTEKKQELSDKEKQNLAILEEKLGKDAKKLLQAVEDVANIYDDISWKSVADTFPEKFDLRERDDHSGQEPEPLGHMLELRICRSQRDEHPEHNGHDGRGI